MWSFCNWLSFFFFFFLAVPSNLCNLNGSSLLFFSVRLFSSCGKWGLLLVAVFGLLTAVASRRPQAQAHGMRAAVVAAQRPRSCGLRASEGGLRSCGSWA